MQETILIAEDEAILREIAKDYFANEGYEVLEAADGEEALHLFQTNDPALIILDIMLPELDGWSVCRRIRKTSNVPIIMLTARSDEEDTLLGFELGADDYVTKPYSPPILMARAKRLLDSRRRQPVNAVHQSLSLGGISLNLTSRSAAVDGRALHLTFTEYEILVLLMKNPGMVITREQFIAKIWGYEDAGDDRTLNTHIRNLRIKLGDKSSLITTILRIGYKFEDPA
ncbi:DNA-binding response regulator [Paenibacillus rhizosphaerae]|uniref:DNA-binding response regulator n=2 Tax=Paenibacillus TaxID=44249 RepID=A0A1R1F0I2_9BACL|nr:MULTISPECIES: response regulator transcription factor [Paenibacillus]OMF57551.1 DNA-binding response regulator [Paenibacillus rhizosphaerae]GIO54240.1 DNA-binding response regulator [Paenibacillus cineris]